MGHPGFPKQIADKGMWSLLVQQKKMHGEDQICMYMCKKRMQFGQTRSNLCSCTTSLKCLMSSDVHNNPR